MRFIQQLTETINPQLSHIVSSVSSDNMLEQFYAIYIMRLCDKALLAQLSLMTDTSNLFEKVWSQKSHRDIICHELSVSHYLEEDVTLQLLNEASPLVYQDIEQKATADDVTIFDFLQPHVDDIKTLFPIWIDSVIPRAILSGEPQEDVDPTTLVSAPVEENNEVAENAEDIDSAEPTPSADAEIDNIAENVENEEQPTYVDLPKTDKRTRRKKGKPARRKKPPSPRDSARRKKILIIAIPFVILNLIVVGALIFLKKAEDTKTPEQTEVVLTAQQDEVNQGYAVPPAELPEANQDMEMVPELQQPPQVDGQNMPIPPQQAQQPMNQQNMPMPPQQAQQPINQQNMPMPPQQPQQNMAVPPAQPPQANYQNMPPVPPQQPMDMPPNAQMNMPPPPPQMPAYNEPPVVNNPPPQPSMSINQSSNATVFEFSNNNESGISEAQLDELTNVEIIAEELENESQ